MKTLLSFFIFVFISASFVFSQNTDLRKNLGGYSDGITIVYYDDSKDTIFSESTMIFLIIDKLFAYGNAIVDPDNYYYFNILERYKDSILIESTEPIMKGYMLFNKATLFIENNYLVLAYDPESLIDLNRKKILFKLNNITLEN
jgi:hypothetical protein